MHGPQAFRQFTPLVLILSLGTPQAARSQDPVLEAWLAGGDPLPSPEQEAPPSEAVPIRYWEPDSLERIAREWGYLLEQTNAARELLGDQELLSRIEAEASRVVESSTEGDAGLLNYASELSAKLAQRRAAINALVTHALAAAVSWAEPYTRLEPNALPPVTPPGEDASLGTCGGEGRHGVDIPRRGPGRF